MVNENVKKKAHELVKIAKGKGLVTKYSDFCKTKLAKKTSLNDEEVNYYISEIKGEIK